MNAWRSTKRVGLYFILGVPIFLRYGHEMNGNWPSYGLKPIEFREGFRRLTNIVRRVTNVTAMVWGPNVGTTYPFDIYNSTNRNTSTPLISLANFAELDTNGDGVIDGLDDPYGPYYPGSEYVDWVALSLYWYPDAFQNIRIWDDYFEDTLTGVNNYGNNVIDRLNPQVLTNNLHNFYQRFAVEQNKPFMIPETGAPWFPGTTPVPPTLTEVAIKQQWWRQMYNQTIFDKYPRLKAIIQFEESKPFPMPGEVRDFRVIEALDVREAFKNDVTSNPNMLWAQQLSYGCGGQIETKP